MLSSAEPPFKMAAPSGCVVMLADGVFNIISLLLEQQQCGSKVGSTSIGIQAYIERILFENP